MLPIHFTPFVPKQRHNHSSRAESGASTKKRDLFISTLCIGVKNIGLLSKLLPSAAVPQGAASLEKPGPSLYCTAQGRQISDLHQQGSLHSWPWDRYCPENKILPEQLLIQSEWELGMAPGVHQQSALSDPRSGSRSMVLAPISTFSYLFYISFPNVPIHQSSPQLCTQWITNSRHLQVDLLLPC